MKYDYESLMPQIFSVIKNAGDKLVEIQQQCGDHEVVMKDEEGYISPQTIADRASDAILEKGMTEIFPDIDYVSEENAENKQRENGWAVIKDYQGADPLDGTKGWINKKNTFAILFHHIIDAQVVFGMVYRPALKEGYYAIKNKGAYSFEGSPENRQRLQVTPTNLNKGLRVGSQVKYFDMQRVIEGCEGMTINNLSDIEQNRDGIKSELGAKMQCQVAENELDLVVFLMDKCAAGTHDIAASSLIVSEAGGYFTDLYGNQPDFTKPWLKTEPYIVYSNPAVFEAFTKNLFAKYQYKDRVFTKISEQ